MLISLGPQNAIAARIHPADSRAVGMRIEIAVQVRLPRRSSANELLTSLTNLEGVESVDASDIAE